MPVLLPNFGRPRTKLHVTCHTTYLCGSLSACTGASVACSRTTGESISSQTLSKGAGLESVASQTLPKGAGLGSVASQALPKGAGLGSVASQALPQGVGLESTKGSRPL